VTDREPIVVRRRMGDDCCSGCCAWNLLIALAIFPFAMLHAGLTGEAQWWWIPVGGIGCLVVLFFVFAAIDHYFKLGILKGVEERQEERQQARREPENEELRKAADLLARGYITAEEYERIKQEILDKTGG
jgi:uncharacterized membrane protein